MGQKELWNSISHGYSVKRGYGKGLMTGEKRALAEIFMKHEIRSVLEVGCGAGRHVRSLRSMGIPAVGIDFSFGMLREARKLGNEPYALADAYNLPFSDMSFDCVSCLGNTIGSLDAQRAALEMMRVSRRICVIDFRMERGKSGILERRFDGETYGIRVWNHGEVKKMLMDMEVDFYLKTGQKLCRGYFFYAVIRK